MRADGQPGAPPLSAATRVLIESDPAGLVILDTRGRILFANGAARRYAGTRAAPARLAELLGAVAPSRSERRALVGTIRAALDGAAPTPPVEVASSRHGTYLMVAAGTWRDESGRVAGAVVSLSVAGPLRLMNEQLEQYAARLEQMVFERTRELERSEQKYRDLFDAGPDIYVTVNRAGRIEEVNRTALRLTGYGRRDLVGRRATALLGHEARRTVWRALPGFLEHGTLENLEFELPRKDGQPLHVIANAALVQDAGGRPLGARVVLRDITHRTLLQRQLSAVDRLAATGQLAAGVAHEINNPLQAVLVHLSLVEEELPRDFSERDSWDRILEGVHRIQQIVADLLDLHRGTDQDSGFVDVNRVVGEALGLVQVPARHRGVTLLADFAAQLPAVRASGRHLYQITLNLLLNAMDAVPRGGSVALRTRHAIGQNHVEIDISDSGPGIPEEMLAHIFDPFRTTRGRRGTGLGLFVTYGLVRQYGGRIHVDSAPGRGTTFRVYFPADAASLAEPADAPPVA